MRGNALAAYDAAMAEFDFSLPLRFRWPVPGRVRVTETTYKHGKELRLRYVAELTRDAEGLWLRLQEHEALDVDPRSVAPALAFARALPGIRIREDGTFGGIVDLESALIAAVASYVRTTNDGAAAQQLHQQLRSPPIQHLLREGASEFWRAWVGVWVGQVVPPGAEVRRPFDTRLPEGLVAPGMLFLRNEGLGADGLAHLVATSVMEGEGFTGALAGFMQQVAATSPVPDERAFTTDLVESARKEVTVRATLRPDTLQPAQVAIEQATMVRVRGQGRRCETLRRRYDFDWL